MNTLREKALWTEADRLADRHRETDSTPSVRRLLCLVLHLEIHLLVQEATSEEIKAILHVLGQAHFKNLSHQEELTGTDLLRLQFGGSSAIGGADSIRQQLLQSCPSLSSGPAGRIDQLLKVWKDVCSRLFSHYRMAAKAYFTYLHLSGEVRRETFLSLNLNLMFLLLLFSGVQA